MNKIEVLENINLGNEVAEYDDNIGHYYIDTNYVYDFVNDKYDIVKGVKGSGKTAMLVALCENQMNYPNLQNKILQKAMQIKGDPDFKRAFDTVTIGDTDTQKIIDAWKIYIINIIWKQVKLRLYGYENLEKYLQSENIITDKNSILGKLQHALKRVKLMGKNSYNTNGSMEQSVEVSYNDNISDPILSFNQDLIDFNQIFNDLNNIIVENNTCIWVMMDRLDDAFPDNSYKDNLILKALFYAYKDICTYKGFKIKIFIREDIFDEITKDTGFTSLTHVSAKTMKSLIWDREVIEKLIVERLLFNPLFYSYLKEFGINPKELTSIDRKQIIFKYVKSQVDVGRNKPDTIGWIINHVEDSNGVYTPRDVIKLLDIARESQLNQLKAANTTGFTEDYLIDQNAIRESFKIISRDKLITQLYAEYPKYRSWIEKFENQKAEHNEKTLFSILGKQWKFRIEKLKRIGFIEEKTNTWKIPFIYREGLNISQGKAF